MKVLLINGSPNQNGCTNRALVEIAHTLHEEDIETEIFWIGNKAISGCLACYTCMKTGKCVIKGDKVSEFLELAKGADGFIFGSPVHYAAASGAITSFMNRAFLSDLAGNGNKTFYMKPAAAVVSARRAGTTATFDQLNKYFTIQEMPVISSRYWNMVHGNTPEDVEQDMEGLHVLRVLARNMAYFLRCKEAGKKAGVPLPKLEEYVFTNFIR
ncbi:nadph-dependent fmn reductase [Lucifera butyrica]|uniref:Nadph-dependent fmn reductase n=1 Tax=Lucifera butyrica TaxID=1351585 RepID=A0A498RAU6_9FIRM|nr:flavodoxin family protein [Lucifera butyrica]VBB08604.1 nadph-dependent fmn reductase [Lucifera butyrica]